MTEPDVADLVAIDRLQRAYGDAVTRRAWDEVAALFGPDAPVRLDLRGDAVLEHVGGEAIAGFIAGAVERFEFFEFAVLNAVVTDVDGDAAAGRVYICELRQDAATHRWTNAYGLYQDRYARVDGRWRFAARDYSSLARSAPDGDADTPGMVVFPMPRT